MDARALLPLHRAAPGAGRIRARTRRVERRGCYAASVAAGRSASSTNRGAGVRPARRRTIRRLAHRASGSRCDGSRRPRRHPRRAKTEGWLFRRTHQSDSAAKPQTRWPERARSRGNRHRRARRRVDPGAIEKLDSLQAIAKQVKDCTRCSLPHHRNHPVPGEGDPTQDLVCVGEAPGAKEDETAGRSSVRRVNSSQILRGDRSETGTGLHL